MVIYAATVWIRNGGTERALLSELQFIPRAYNYLKCHSGKNAMHTNSHTPTQHTLTDNCLGSNYRERKTGVGLRSIHPNFGNCSPPRMLPIKTN